MFLCASRGNGKFEILTQTRERFSNWADFHLDATHNLRPIVTATQISISS